MSTEALVQGGGATPGVDRPLVSIVMAVYNGEDYVAEAVESLLWQAYAPLEIVIVDDGSTDGTARMLRDYAARDSRIVLVPQENSGVTRALVRGLAVARGEFIARMDGDDVSTPDRIARQAAALAARPDAVAVSCRMEFIRADGTRCGLSHPAIAPEIVPWFQIFFNRISGHGQMMYRRDAYDRAGGYDPEVRYAQDYDLWQRMSRLGDFLTLDDILYKLRVDHGSITSRNWAAQQGFSFVVTRRAFEELTGAVLSEADIRLLREFWDLKGDVRFTRADAKRVERLVQLAYRRYAAERRLSAAHRRVLRDAVAVRWLYWLARLPTDELRTVASYAARALGWAPWMAPRTLSVALRRASWEVRRFVVDRAVPVPRGKP